MSSFGDAETHDFLKKVGGGASLLALDVGSKTIGVASGNLISFTSTALMTVKRQKFSNDMDVLKLLIKEYDSNGIVVGYPINMDGSEGRRCQSIRDFVIEMKNYITLPVLLCDERLSTDSVDGMLDNSVNKRKAKETGITDQYAAKIILDRALEAFRRNSIS